MFFQTISVIFVKHSGVFKGGGEFIPIRLISESDFLLLFGRLIQKREIHLLALKWHI